MAVKNSLEIGIEQVWVAYKRGGIIRVAECLRQIDDTGMTTQA